MSQAAGVQPIRAALQSPPVDLSQPIAYSQLQGQTVVITGGASGIGAAIATLAAQHGANTVLGDVDHQRGTALAARLRQLSGREHHHYVRLDVTDWPSQLAFFQAAQALSPHGGIDCVVANAGINDSAESEALEINLPRVPALTAPASPPAPPRLRTLQVNLEGALYTSTLALSYLLENPGSRRCSAQDPSGSRDRHLLLVSSVAGVSAFPGASVYAAAKHGVVGLFRALRISAPVVHGVRVNMVCPQFVETPLLGPRALGSLIGTAKTRLDDVVEAAIRLIADRRITGRALMAGTRASQAEIEAAGLSPVTGRHTHGAIWDIYCHDFEQSDPVVRRTVGLLNLASSARGWQAVAEDWYHFGKALMAEAWRYFLG